MRATATVLDNNKIKLTVEVDEPDLAEVIDRTAKELAQQIDVKGFRKGKAPKNMIEARLGGPVALRGEAIRNGMPDFYAHAVADTLIDPIGQPEINIVEGEETGTLKFEAEVEVRPEVQISNYKSIKVEIPSPNVADSEIEEQINRLRETDAHLEDVDRPILTGDVVTLNVTAVDPQGEVEPIEVQDFAYTIGSNQITDGLDELSLGLKAGETLDLTGRGPQAMAMNWHFEIVNVKEKILPDLTDEWMAENSDFETVDAFRDDLVTQLRRRKVIEAQMSRRDNALAALAELVAPEFAPDVLVEQETDQRLHDLGHRLEQQRLSVEMFLQVTNQTPEQLVETLRQDAVKGVQLDLALRALVKVENLDPTPAEVEQELIETAISMNVTAEELSKNLRDSGRVVAFHAEVAKMKASRWLMSNATYVDETGAEIDRTLLESDQSATDTL